MGQTWTVLFSVCRAYLLSHAWGPRGPSGTEILLLLSLGKNIGYLWLSNTVIQAETFHFGLSDYLFLISQWQSIVLLQKSCISFVKERPLLPLKSLAMSAELRSLPQVVHSLYSCSHTRTHAKGTDIRQRLSTFHRINNGLFKVTF